MRRQQSPPASPRHSRNSTPPFHISTNPTPNPGKKRSPTPSPSTRPTKPSTKPSSGPSSPSSSSKPKPSPAKAPRQPPGPVLKGTGFSPYIRTSQTKAG